MKIIILTLTSWNEIPRARHQVANALIEIGHEVIFVERNVVGFPNIQAVDIKPSLTVITPSFPVDYRFRYRLPFINEVYQYWLFGKVQKIYRSSFCINFDFSAKLVGNYFSEYVYYCNDDYIGNSKYSSWIVNLYHNKMEKVVAQNASFCVVTAKSLMKKLEKYNPNTYLIPLGGPSIEKVVIPEYVSKVYPIKIVLMGSLHLGHVSPDLVNEISKNPDFLLTIVGTIDRDFKNCLTHTDKIVTKGIITGRKLCEEMRSYDVAIAPYDLEGINSGVTPNKLFQYLASSCPVVITYIPNISGNEYPEGTVYIAHDNEEFKTNIYRAFEENCLEFIASRQKYAQLNSWKKRIEILDQLIIERLSKVTPINNKIETG